MVMAMWVSVKKMIGFIAVLALYSSPLVRFCNKNIKMCTLGFHLSHKLYQTGLFKVVVNDIPSQ